MQRAVNISNLGENGAVMAESILEGNIAYVGACEKYFYAIDIRDGHLVWEYKTGGVMVGPAVMHNNVIYFGCFDNCLYALSKEGVLLWKLRTGGIIAGATAAFEGLIYFGSCDTYFYAVSARTHEVLWKFKTGDEIVSDILVDEGRIYFGSQDGYLYCLELNGCLAWKFRTNGPIILGAPAASKDMVFFGSCDQNIYALTKGGEFKWGFRTGDMVYNAPLVLDGAVCIGSRDRYFYCLDQKTGGLKWKFRANDEVNFTPRTYNDLILVSSDKVYAFTKNGNVMWSYPFPPYLVPCGIRAGEGIVIFGSADGYIRGLNANNGQLIWKFKTKSSATPRMRNVIAPPKWDPNLYDKFEPIEKKNALKRIDDFNPYTFDTLSDDFFRQDTDKYIIGEAETNMYREANEPGQYGAQKKRDKKRDEEFVKITRTFFGN